MARDGAGSVSLAPPRAVFARAVARGPADSEEAWQRIARLRSRRQAPLSQSGEQQSKHLALEPRSDATLVAMTMFPPLRLRPHRLGGRGIEPHSPRRTHRPASVLLQVMSERQRMRSARQHGPWTLCPPTKKAAALISSGRRRLGLRPRPTESNARPERMQGAQPHEEQSAGDVPRPVPSSARDVEAAAVVECLLARVRAGVMSEEQLQSELEAGGVPVPRQWRGQIRSAMKTAAWVEKRKIAPGLGKHQLTMPQGTRSTHSSGGLICFALFTVVLSWSRHGSGGSPAVRSQARA